MNSDTALFLLSETVKTAALISAPVLIIALLVGLIISIFQVVTQIQEMTLTFVPKLAAVAFTLLFFGAWMLTVLMDFATRMFVTAGTIH